MDKRIICVVLLIGYFVPMFVDAQSFYRRRRNRDFVVSFGTGTASYFGELNNPKDRFDTKLNVEFGLEYKFHPRISPKVMLTIFQLVSSESIEGDLFVFMEIKIPFLCYKFPIENLLCS